MSVNFSAAGIGSGAFEECSVSECSDFGAIFEDIFADQPVHPSNTATPVSCEESTPAPNDGILLDLSNLEFEGDAPVDDAWLKELINECCSAYQERDSSLSTDSWLNQLINECCSTYPECDLDFST